MTLTLIMAAGTGSRAGLGYNKLFFEFDGCSILEHTLRAAKPSSDELFVIIGANDAEAAKPIAGKFGAKIIHGGATRTQSVRAGLDALRNYPPDSVVVIHDGARPFAEPRLFEEAVSMARTSGSAVAAILSVDSLREKTSDGTRAIPRENIYCIQTPQAFRLDKILDAYNAASGEFGDDAEVYEKRFGNVNLSSGSRANYKITTRADLGRLLRGSFRIGNGFDTHRLACSRRLILGGVQIPHDKGLLGHSDADVLVHALMDALLSAAGEGDIGTQFPDTDPSYKDADSMELLFRVIGIIRLKGLRVHNMTAALLAEKPRLSPYVEQMRVNLAHALGITTDNAGITVTTTEGLGLVGREEGISCYCTVLLSDN